MVARKKKAGVLALPRLPSKDPYVEVWSVKKRSKTRTIRITRSDAR